MTRATTGPGGGDHSPEERFGGRFDLGGRSLRTHTARGSLVNAVFVVGVNLLTILKGFVVAALIAPSDYGVWGIIITTFITVALLKSVAVADRFIQQDEGDQELAFQRAFTMELLLSGAFTVAFLLAVPLAAAVYGRPELVAPGIVLALVIPAGVLASPLMVFYRRMEFVKQRVVQSLDPIVGFAVTVSLAVAGAGYWSFVAGIVAGSWATAIVALIASPYRLRIRFDRAVAKDYLSFSWPLFVAGAGGVAIAQGSLLVGEHTAGLAAVGVIALASSVTTYAERVDQIITTTLYPAICAVAERTDLLFETFVKSNRLALMWSLPFGLGLILFAPDLVNFILGERWRAATPLLQVFGATTLLYQVGFNWQAFYMARGQTKPTAVVAVITALAFCAATIPLTLTYELDGFAAGMAVMTVVNFAARTWFLTRLFDGFKMARHFARAMAPALPGLAAVLLVRALEPAERTQSIALGELLLFGATTVAATLLMERSLLKEVRGYISGSPDPGPA